MYENLIRTSHETHFVSDTKINRLKLLRKTIEKRLNHTNTLCEQNAEF
jgi:hypothetical protein